MLVGEVRWATRSEGFSWKLSGGRSDSPAFVNTSKKRQVRRAIARRAAPVAGEAERCAFSMGRETRQAASGASSHRTSGTATAPEMPGRRMRATTSASGGRRPAAMRR